jgi:hypothetical protein
LEARLFPRSIKRKKPSKQNALLSVWLCVCAGPRATQGTSTISFSGQTASQHHHITSWSDTQIVATVPQTAAAGPVAVTVNSIPSNLDVIFTVPGPSIASVAPWGGIAGTPRQGFSIRAPDTMIPLRAAF